MAIEFNVPSQVRPYANLSAFPATGAVKTIYIAEDTNKIYRWTGSAYVEISVADLVGYVPYTGATGNVDLGTHTIIAQNATISSSGSGNTATITHSGGSGIGLSITKGGSGEALYVNKTSGSGNAVTVVGNIEATNLKRTGGTSSQFLKADGSVDSTTYITGITIGTTAITSGTVGRVLFEGTGNVVQESANLFWNNTNSRLGIGTANPNSALEVVDTGGASFVAAARFLVPNNNVAGRVSQFYLGQAMTSLNSIAWSFHYQGNGSTANYQSFGFNGIATPALTMFGTLNVGINTTTDAGFKLDVNGTARVSGNLTLTGGSLLMNNNNIYIARGAGGASDGMEIRALSSGTDAVKVTTSSVSISSSGGITYQASAQLAVDSTTRGFLPPRMTTTQKNAIATPATGLMVYDNVLNRPCFYDGTTWITL